MALLLLFDYQSNRHCAKTESLGRFCEEAFDYQSNRHCAKTKPYPLGYSLSLITSQIDTAPKLTCNVLVTIQV